ncbi:helix-turn-helix domain-containing protein [Brucella tritici]|uniref:helix-turn-helix domain-containing protein n=1 Tax=Brucella tritici TaxID=94626 RepID=UPI001F40BE7E|nr:helix-turn-helix transcriptional regulator [Brucella tritici]
MTDPSNASGRSALTVSIQTTSLSLSGYYCRNAHGAPNSGVYEGDSNIFAELSLPEADGHFLKAQIVEEIYRLTKDMKLTQARAGDLMGITQPEVSRLFKGNFREYSVERLMGFLTAFAQDVEIVTRPRDHSAGRGHISFTAARATA